MPYRCMTRYAELTHGARCLPFQEWQRAPSQFSRWCSIKKTEPCSMCFWKPEFQNRRRRQVLRRGPRSAAEAANPDAFLECSDRRAPEGTANDPLHSKCKRSVEPSHAGYAPMGQTPKGKTKGTFPPDRLSNSRRANPPAAA